MAKTVFTTPDYTSSPSTTADHIVAFCGGAVAGFFVFFIFYRIILLGIIGGVFAGIFNIFSASNRAVDKRKRRLRTQFFDLLESLAVGMRAGNPMFTALESASADIRLIHGESSDINVELSIILARFQNSVPLSKSFLDFAQRSELEDIMSFASIYATIEGKSNRADEIVKKTQEIISDKMQIEMEIQTMMTGAKQEANIMLFMPLVILAVIGYAGAGFMDAIYTTAGGRVVATGGLIMFFISFLLMKKFSEVKL